MAGELTAVTDDTFEVDVLKSDKPVLVDFWAPWCAPCRMVTPVLEEIASVHGEKLTILAMNTDDNPQAASRYGVTGLPTLGVWQNGELVKTIVGAKPKAMLLRELSDWLG